MKNLKAPIYARKEFWVDYYDKRKDYHQRIAMMDYDTNDDFKLEKNMME